MTKQLEPLHEKENRTTETLSEAKERLAKVRKHFQGRHFSDSTKLFREDRKSS